MILNHTFQYLIIGIKVKIRWKPLKLMVLSENDRFTLNKSMIHKNSMIIENKSEYKSNVFFPY